jgi:hypothetical protein
MLKGNSVSYNKWLEVEDEEIKRGQKIRDTKIREKILDRNEMIKLAT